MIGKYLLEYCKNEDLDIFKHEVGELKENYFWGISFECPVITISFCDSVESHQVNKMLDDLKDSYTPILRVGNHLRLIHTSDFPDWYIYEKGMNLSLRRCERAMHSWSIAEKTGCLDELKHQLHCIDLNSLLSGIMYAYEGRVVANWNGEGHELEYVGE